MTDPSGLTPEQDAVRRLLADARHDGPTPPEVVACLDETLASLVSERVSERGGADEQTVVPRATSASVVDLGARRRRTVGIGLLAAAAVVVAGVAIGQGLPRLSGNDADEGTSADSASGGDRSLAESGEDSSSGGSQYDDGGADEGPESLKSTAAAPEAGLPTLSSTDADLDDDLLDLRSSVDDSERVGAAGALSSCDLRGIGRGRRVVAQVDGQVGVVVFRRADGAAQQADLYVCGNPEPVRTLTLPAP